jgi:limonene-1,2-epoxide hydrolase
MSAVIEDRLRLDDLFAAIDNKDTETFLGFLTEDARFRFGSAPAVCGQAAIRAAVDGFFGSITSSRHELDKCILDGTSVVCEGSVHYCRLDQREVTVPFVDVFEYAGERIAEYKIYIDISPLLAD